MKKIINWIICKILGHTEILDLELSDDGFKAFCQRCEEDVDL